jgi:ABC-2 type transport system ATP-binding protein
MTPILAISRVCRSFCGFELKDIDLCVQPGSILGLIGPNGAGKTTLMKLVMGQIQPASGTIDVCGLSLPVDLKEIRNRIGYVPEDPPFLPNKRVEDIVGFAGPFFDRWDSSRFGQLIEQFGIGLSQKVSALSRGRKSLLSLAVALSHEADLLLLDEPAAGLDAQGRRQVLRLMAEFVSAGDNAVMIATHQTDGLAPLADRVAFLHRGRLVQENGTDDLLAQWKWLSYRDGAVCAEIEQTLTCCESGAFGKRGLLPIYPEHREVLESGQASGDIHIGPATIDDILIALTEGK